MACSFPQKGFVGRNGQFVTSRKMSPTGAPMQIACGRCAGCRKKRAAQWATRISHESMFHEASCFVTLTFNDEHLPSDYSVSVRTAQLFIKKLREHLWRNYKIKISFFLVAEYGSKGDPINGKDKGRPHYHVIIFGYDFSDDRYLWRKSPRGHDYFRSPLLETVWPYGNCDLTGLTFANAAYCARYSFKKLGGALADSHYSRVHPVTGEVHQVEREFMLCSKRPAIGLRWFQEYESDAFPSDFVVVEGRKRPIPDYYSRKLKGRFASSTADPEALVPKDDLYPVLQKRKKNSAAHSSDRTPERLAVLNECEELREKRLERDL